MAEDGAERRDSGVGMISCWGHGDTAVTVLSSPHRQMDPAQAVLAQPCSTPQQVDTGASVHRQLEAAPTVALTRPGTCPSLGGRIGTGQNRSQAPTTILMEGNWRGEEGERERESERVGERERERLCLQ